MSRYPERAEVNPLETVANPQRNGYLPRELRISPLAARLLLATLATSSGATALEIAQGFSGNTTSTVEAAAGCRVRLAVLGFQYIHNPNTPGTKGVIGPHDFVFPPVRFGDAVVYWQKDSLDPRSPKQEIARRTLVPKEDHQEAVFQLDQDSNTKGADQSPALRVEVGFAEDPIKQTGANLPVTKPVVIRCGNVGWVEGGRYANDKTIDEMTQGSKFPIRKVGTAVDEATKRIFGISAGIAPKVDNPQENLRDIRNNLDRLKQESVEVKGAERAKKGLQAAVVSTGMVTVTAAVSPTVRASGGYTYTEEVRAALEKVMTDQLDKAISPLQKDLRGTNDALRDIKTDLRGQKESLDEASKRTKAIKDAQDKIDKELTEIKGRLAVTATAPTSPTVPAEGRDRISLSDLGGIGSWIGSILDWPAKLLDQVTEPDVQHPLRAGIDVLAWLVVLRALRKVQVVGIVGIPGAYILGASSYLLRFGVAKWRHSRAVATAAAAGNLPPAWIRPTLPI